jgi:hypothetical protein
MIVIVEHGVPPHGAFSAEVEAGSALENAARAIEWSVSDGPGIVENAPDFGWPSARLLHPVVRFRSAFDKRRIFTDR